MEKIDKSPMSSQIPVIEGSVCLFYWCCDQQYNSHKGYLWDHLQNGISIEVYPDCLLCGFRIPLIAIAFLFEVKSGILQFKLWISMSHRLSNPFFEQRVQNSRRFYYPFMDKGRRTSHSPSFDLKKPHRYLIRPLAQCNY